VVLRVAGPARLAETGGVGRCCCSWQEGGSGCCFCCCEQEEEDGGGEDEDEEEEEGNEEEDGDNEEEEEERNEAAEVGRSAGEGEREAEKVLYFLRLLRGSGCVEGVGVEGGSCISRNLPLGS